MAQICYRGRDGKAIAIKNPTKADEDEMWDVILERIGPDFTAEFERQMADSIFYQRLNFGPELP